MRSRPLEVEVALPITANNVATKSTTTEGNWDWTVFIQAPEEVLDQVDSVEYTLHPTFFDPVRIVDERGTGPYAFSLSRTGWGTFGIKIRVFLKNGRIHYLTHLLRFSDLKILPSEET